MEEHTSRTGVKMKVLRAGWISWRFIVFLLESTADSLIEKWVTIRREADLFGGVGFFILGFFGFRSGRYCDGNTADYLSCTRPATFYYYDWIHIALIIIGVFLICIWLLKRRSAHH
jgi:hypothetical protein